MAKHTAGPWKFERMQGYEDRARILGQPLAEHDGFYRDNNGDWVVGGGDGRIAAVRFQGKAKRGEAYNAPDPEGMANGRLISAAPDMLEALKKTLETVEWMRSGATAQSVNWDTASEQIKSAIAKAEAQ